MLTFLVLFLVKSCYSIENGTIIDTPKVVGGSCDSCLVPDCACDICPDGVHQYGCCGGCEYDENLNCVGKPILECPEIDETTSNDCMDEIVNVNIPETCTNDVLSNIDANTDDNCNSMFTDCGCDKNKLTDMLIFDGVNYNSHHDECCYLYTSKRTDNPHCGGKMDPISHIVLQMDCDDETDYEITNNGIDTKATTDPASCLKGIKLDKRCKSDECTYQVCIKYPNTNQCCTNLGFYNIKSGNYNIKHQIAVPSCNNCGTNCTKNAYNCGSYSWNNCPSSCAVVKLSENKLACESKVNANLLTANKVFVDTNPYNKQKKDYNKQTIIVILSISFIIIIFNICVFVFVITKYHTK